MIFTISTLGFSMVFINQPKTNLETKLQSNNKANLALPILVD